MTRDEVVEVIAQGMWAEFHKTKPERFAVACPNPQRWRDLARAAIRAVHDAGGLVVGKMPDEYPAGSNYADGHRAALAAVRAAAVEVE